VNERRLNGEGIIRSDLPWVLTQRRFVLRARKNDRCLLCCAPEVNEAGLCDNCYCQLPADELALAEKWMSGVGP
jgi:hypothetical protein